MGDKSSGEGPPPPSPLTGAYLLIVLPQTHQLQHKDCVIHYLTKGLLTWDKTDCHVDLEKELQTITAQAPEGEEAKNGERLIQFASENLVTEVLIHPQLNTLVQCMRNLLSSFTRHRHIIHAGYTCAGNGAWMLQDGTYSFADFAEMYQEHEVQRVLRAYENTVSVDVHCLQEGDWNNLKGKDPFSKVSRVRLNPKDCVTSTPAIKGFSDYLSPYVTNGSIDELLESSDVVGNIRFSHPTLYVFPGGQGDAALFGINGFNMLVDGGFARKACFWDFSRHLDRLDAVLMTRLNNGNIQGMTSLLQRKRLDHVYPQIGHFFCNMQERRHPLSPDGDKDRDPLLVSLFDQGQDMLGSLRHLQLKPQPCYRDPVLEPVNLYHKVGHGKLDMYVISPAKDSREVREFMAKWTTQDSKIFCSFTKRGGEFNFPLCNKVSICALLVWQPANPEDNITRLLFPGSTPQHKIFEGLDKLKNLEFMKHAVCSARTLSPSSSSVGLNVRTVSKPKVPASVEKIIENDDKKIEAVKQPSMKPPIGQTEKQPPKSQPPSRPPSKQKPAEKPKEKPKTEVEVKTEKTETAKTEKAKPDKNEKTEAVQKIDKPKEKPKRPITKQPEKKKPIGGEKKDSLKSSPTTPKKTAENKVSEAQPKPEVKSRASSRTKPSPSATPAKSTKEANNRKVVEQKKEATKRMPPPKKEEPKKAERPTAPRKSVPSPSKTDKQQVSPVKGARPVTRPKLDAKKTTKAEKDVVTESVASTPSTVDVELAKVKEDLAEKETKGEEIKVAEAVEPPSLSKDEEDEILVIEKIEIDGDGKGKPEESIAVHIRNSREDIIADDEGKEEANVDLPSDEKKEIMKTSDITIPDTDSKQFSEDVQDVTKDAPDTSKSRVEFMTTEEASITKEPATDKLTPREKDGKEKSTDIGDIKQTDESQPDEKFSTTVESGATTAPTLPEDERIPLDEIKEGIEEKYIKEETKEKDVGVTQRPEQPTSLPEVPVIASTPFDQRVQLLKDIVKTPDEVADLPVHEEADGGIFAVDETQLAMRELQRSRDDLLGIPAPKKIPEKKEDAAEEVKLVKDENEKEDATKDLKEDDVVQDEKAVSPTPGASPQKPDDAQTAPEKEDINVIDNEAVQASAIPTSLEDEEILDDDKDRETEKEKLLQKESRDLDKDEDVIDKADKEMINEKQVAKSVVEEENKGKKPVLEDGVPQEEATEAALDGTKTELLESKDDKQDEDGLHGDGQVILDEVAADTKSKSPSPAPPASADIASEPEDKKPEGLKEGDASTMDTMSKTSKSPSPEPKASEPVEAIAESTKSPSPDLKVEGSTEQEPLVEGSQDAVKTSKSPSPEPKKLDSQESAVKTPKSLSPEPKTVAVEEVVTTAKSPLPEKDDEVKVLEEVVAETSKPTEPADEAAKVHDALAKASKTPSPEPKEKETILVEKDAKPSKSPSPEPSADEPKSKSPVLGTEKEKPVDEIIKASRSPSPKHGDGEAVDTELTTKPSKTPSPQPKTEDAKFIEVDGKTSKSPSPEPLADKLKDSVELAKSPEPKVERAEGDDASIKASKSPSPEPIVAEAKNIDVVSKVKSPEPKGDEAKDVDDQEKSSDLHDKDVKIIGELAKVPEPKADIDGAAKSPESKVEDAKSIDETIKLSKSPTPEPKDAESKPKTPSPEPKDALAKSVDEFTKAPKSPSPEPKADQAKEIEELKKSSEAKDGEAKTIDERTTESKSPSPGPKADIDGLAKSPEPEVEDAKVIDGIIKSSKSPEPKDPESKPIDELNKVSKSPSPEPKADLAKDIDGLAKSPEPKLGDLKGIDETIKASKSPSPEPKDAEAKPIDGLTKSPSPEPKMEIGGISKSPEPKVEDAKNIADIIEVSKSRSPEINEISNKIVDELTQQPKSSTPEPQADHAKDIDGLTISPEPKDAEGKLTDVLTKPSKSPEPKADTDVHAKSPKSPSPELEADQAKLKDEFTISPEPDTAVAKGAEAATKASKTPSPEPKVTEVGGIDEFAKEVKSPSPEPKVDTIQDINERAESTEAKDAKTTITDGLEIVSKSPSPEPKVDQVKDISKSPEPKVEDTKDIDELTKTSVSPSPEPKVTQADDSDGVAMKSKSPEVDNSNQDKGVDALPKSPVPKVEEIKDPLITESKTTSPEPKIEDASIIGDITKSPSPEPKADQLKNIDEPAKSPEPKVVTSKDIDTLEKPHDPKVQDNETIDTLIESSTSSSEVKAGEEKEVNNMSTVVESTAEEEKTIDAVIKASKSPSPEPKLDEGKQQVEELAETIGKLSSTALSPELKAEIMQDIDPKMTISKSPSPDPKDSQVPVKSDAQIESGETKDLKGQSIEPKSEDPKSGKLSSEISKTSTPEPTLGSGDPESARLSPGISKTPTPEPTAQEIIVEDKVAKSPTPQLESGAKSPSPTPSADVKTLAIDDGVSKSMSPEPSTELSKDIEFITKASKSPSPVPEKPEVSEVAVPGSISPDIKSAASPIPEIKQVDEQTKMSKSPSPELLTEMAKSPEASIKAPSPSPEPDLAKPSVTSTPEPIGSEAKSLDTQSKDSKTPEPPSKTPEPSTGTSKSPELSSDAAEHVTKSSEPEMKAPVKTPEPSLQQSKTPSPQPTTESPHPSADSLVQEQQKEEILKSDEVLMSQSEIKAQVAAPLSASPLLEPQLNVSKSPSPEPQAVSSKSASPIPLESVDETSGIKTMDIQSDIIEDSLSKKGKTKEQLNQEMMEEKEVDEVSEPEKKDQQNLQTKLDDEKLSKSEVASKVDSFEDSKAESSKLEAEKHDKETNLEQSSDTKHDEGKKEQISTKGIDISPGLSGKEVMDEKETEQSTSKETEEVKMKDEIELETLSVDSKLVCGELSSSTFKSDDRVPSISLREASIEQTSEESKLAEIEKSPSDMEKYVPSASADRKPSSGEVSTKSTDGEEDRKLSGTGSVASEKSGDVSPKDVISSELKDDVVKEAISKIDSSSEEIGDFSSHGLDSAAVDRDILGEIKSSPSTGETKPETIEKDVSLPESIKLEAEKDSVEVRSKDDLKDEALVLDSNDEDAHQSSVTGSESTRIGSPQEQIKSASQEASVTGKQEEDAKLASLDASQPVQVESKTSPRSSTEGQKLESKDTDHDAERLPSKSPSPPTVLDVSSKKVEELSVKMQSDGQMLSKDSDSVIQTTMSTDFTSPVGLKDGKAAVEKEIEPETVRVDSDTIHGSSSTMKIESTTLGDGKTLMDDAKLSQEEITSKTSQLDEIKEKPVSTVTKEATDLKDISSEPSHSESSTTTVTEQLSTSTVVLKQPPKSLEPLDVDDSKTKVLDKAVTQVEETVTSIVTKSVETSLTSKSLTDESLVVKSTLESLDSDKDSSLITNGKTASDIIYETEVKNIKYIGDDEEHGAKKSDIKVTDILDTAERIVSSLNGKNVKSEEPSDYIPSFSETKSYSMTIEGKRGPSDEITVETKTIEEGDLNVAVSSQKGDDTTTSSKPSDEPAKKAEEKSTDSISTTTSVGGMNGVGKMDKEDELKLDTNTATSKMEASPKEIDLGSSTVSKSEILEKTPEQPQLSTSGVGKSEDITSSEMPKDDSIGKPEKTKEPTETVGQALTKVISETAASIGESVSAIGSLLPSGLVKSSTSSTKGSATASPDLSRKSDDPTSTAQKDGKVIPDSKPDLASKESLIDVTSSFLSMESGISQGSEKSMDVSASSSKSGEKATETTDKKSSLSSTQVEPPTEKDQPLLHSTTAALRTQRDFSRSETPASDILSDRDLEIGHCTPYSDTSSGQVSRAVTHVWETVEGRPESRHYDSDEDIPGSPTSISSHIPSPPQFEYDMTRPQDPMMMSSFYGSLPGDFDEGVKSLSGELAAAYEYGIHDKGDSLKKELGGDKLSASIRSSLTSTPESSPLPERRFESMMATSSKEPSTAPSGVSPPAQPSSVLPSSSSLPPKPDPIGKWDKPLGLPPPHSTDSSTPYLRWNPYKEWGKPLGLPSPAPPPREDTDVEVDTSGSAKTTPKKVSKMNAENNKYSSNAVKEINNKSKRSESPVKKVTGKDSRKSGPTPVYMDLSYVPHHGNSNYATVEFFKRVRARYYVFSGTEPSKEVFNALLEAKQSWEDKDLEVTIIPTYDTDTLGYWIAENEETLSKLKIDLSPSASRCTINLQDHDTSCSAYRLEF